MTARRILNRRLFRRAFLGIGLASAAVMVWASATNRGLLVGAAAGIFAVAALVVAVLCNVEAWRRSPSPDADANALATYGALRLNALLSATAYGWGALAMQGMYLTPLTGLKWQHGWQYALAMALLGAGWLAVARTLRRGLHATRPLTWPTHFRWAGPLAIAQGLIAAGCLTWLIGSGKLWSLRTDWAANRVFAALAMAILALSVVTAVSQMRLRRIG